ncbi:type I-E CRISPR-associated protein Cse2/CasB [Tepidiphilus baoligensis]|uniref:Type I-E CRISPR-associated protein Cse2/CasB n=1 Tax=Tepidiphilus baoligensis TaxID=2698687 RepID=A0ABX1QKI5_9PROT|nr:type I-E CRISPR-associated protein Cse2/CasB [Tepidiphilus baoligensis]NMH16460.1 type I-E CRISPR-associated protein Cse2/CasB [Tepidiphilus baoligensis]
MPHENETVPQDLPQRGETRSRAQQFINHLARVCEDRGARAILRRSAAFAPGEYVPAFPFVEPFLSEDTPQSERPAFYLGAMLYALHGQHQEGRSLARAFGALWRKNDQRPSLERRFIALLEADADGLPEHLRQIVTLLKEEAFDHAALLADLRELMKPYATERQNRIRARWAKDFYRTQGSAAGESPEAAAPAL